LLFQVVPLALYLQVAPLYTGVVYYADNILTGEWIAVKMESLDADNPKLSHEWKVYKSLSGGLGIPRVSWFGSERGYRAMTMSLLGPSLEDLFDACNRKFTLKTVLMLADQLVSCITLFFLVLGVSASLKSI
jgi:casein kinase I homolog HRR25